MCTYRTCTYINIYNIYTCVCIYIYLSIQLSSKPYVINSKFDFNLLLLYIALYQENIYLFIDFVYHSFKLTGK